eukprot:1156415-Pelagomonas_calceolata.AAC.2
MDPAGEIVDQMGGLGGWVWSRQGGQDERSIMNRLHSCQAACLPVCIMESWRAVTRRTLKRLDGIRRMSSHG